MTIPFTITIPKLTADEWAAVYWAQKFVPKGNRDCEAYDTLLKLCQPESDMRFTLNVTPEGDVVLKPI